MPAMLETARMPFHSDSAEKEVTNDGGPTVAAAQSEADTDYWTRRCDAIDLPIDGLVYELYGMTEDEIAIVEGRA